MKPKSEPHPFDLAQPWTGVVPIASVSPQPGQPRKHFNAEKLAQLADSLKVRQEVPCTVVPLSLPDQPEVRWMLIDGERRWRALQLAGLPGIKIAYSPDITETTAHSASLTSNFCREGHTKMEISNALVVEQKAGKTVEQIARTIGVSTVWVYNHLRLQYLHPDLQALLDEPTPRRDRLPMGTAIELCKLPPFSQKPAWEAAQKKVGDGLREGLEHAVRGSATATLLRKGGEQSDVRHLIGQIRRSKTQLSFVLGMDDVMLGRLGPDQAADALVVLETIRADAIKLRTRLERLLERSILPQADGKEAA